MEQKVISKRGGGRSWLLTINSALFVSGVAVSASGLILQCHYHLLKNPAGAVVWALDRAEWSALHSWASICFLAAALGHVWAHRTWYVNLWKKSISARQRPTLVLTLLLLVVSMTGLIPLCIYCFGGSQVVRHTFVEIHDKIALLFFAVAVGHTFKRGRWFFNQLRSKL